MAESHKSKRNNNYHKYEKPYINSWHNEDLDELHKITINITSTGAVRIH